VVAADRTGLFQGSQVAVPGEKLRPTRPASSVTVRPAVLLQFTNGRHTGQAWLPILIDGSVPNANQCRMLRLVC
jgi:hypothetical protein